MRERSRVFDDSCQVKVAFLFVQQSVKLVELNLHFLIISCILLQITKVRVRRLVYNLFNSSKPR